VGTDGVEDLVQRQAVLHRRYARGWRVAGVLADDRQAQKAMPCRAQ